MITYEKGYVCIKEPNTNLYIVLGNASFSDTIRFELKTMKIPSMSSSSTFAYDKGASQTLNISFTRRNPDVEEIPNDSRTWNNTKWVRRLSALIDRWQMRTDGCRFTFIPKDENVDEWDEYNDINGYISTMKFKWSAGVPDVITCDLSFLVGSTYANITSRANEVIDPTIPTDDMYIQMSDISTMKNYTLLSLRTDETKVSEIVSCIESYSIEGGMNQPFEILKMSIPKKRLTSVAPQLVNNIVAGKNLVKVNAYGKGDYVVTSCALNNNTYNITAYACSELFKAMVSVNEYTQTSNPLYTIRSILGNGVRIGSRWIYYKWEDGSVITALKSDTYYTEWAGEIKFPTETSLWRMIQVCAMKLGAKIWFSEDKCYLIDTRVSGHTQQYGEIDIFANEDEASSTYKDVVGSAESGSEGTTTVINTLTVSFGDNEKVTIPSEDDKSVAIMKDYYDWAVASQNYYGKREGSLSLPEIKNITDAKIIGYNYISYLADSQNSIGYTLKETVNDGTGVSGWHRTYENPSSAEKILDRTNDLESNNISHCLNSAVGTDPVKPNLLTMSSYERAYPDGTCKYWWGVQKATDMSSTISQIQSALKNG